MRYALTLAALLFAAPATAGEPVEASGIHMIDVGRLPPIAESHDLVLQVNRDDGETILLVADKGYRMCGPLSFRKGKRDVFNIPAGKCLPEDSSAVEWGGK